MAAIDGIDLTFDLTEFAQHLIDEAGVPFEPEGPGGPQRLAAEAASLFALLGVDVEVEAEAPPDGDPAVKYVLPGTRIHVRAGKLGWAAALSLVPIVASVVASGGSLLPLYGLAPLAGLLKDQTTVLTPSDKALVIAAAAVAKENDGIASATKVADALRRDEHDTEKTMRRLAGDGVLNWVDGGFTVPF